MSFGGSIHHAFSAFDHQSHKTDQGKIRYMRAPKALSIGIAMLAVLTVYAPATAQDVVPETPPELRDFRLDPEPAKPQPEPTVAQPAVTPPPAATTAPDSEAAQPRPRPQSPRVVPRATTQAAPVVIQDQPVTSRHDSEAPPEPAGPAPVDQQPVSNASEAAATDKTPAQGLPFWQVGGALALGSIALFGMYWMRRRRKGERADSIAELPAVIEPEQIDIIDTPAPVLAAPVPTPAIPVKKPRITLDFIPEKATISFTTLTIKGQLRLINDGDAPAMNMELRAGLISASAQQEAAISAFNADTAQIPAETIGEAKPGERIGMAIEMSVPLTDMQSFPLGEKQLFVPIMVANLSYRGGGNGGNETTQIACMIGREASPPAARMGPLRLDLGPRSFTPLGQRPVLGRANAGVTA
jgi:hypothetical protein